MIQKIAHGQDLLQEIPPGPFSPDIEQVEDYYLGINIYDKYCIYLEKPLIRRDESGAPINGKVEDDYSNGFLLHKGTYTDGKVKAFTNYYTNGSKERKFKGKKEGQGELYSYYLNGYYRSVYKFEDFNIFESEVYYNNGVLKRKEILDKETLIPQLIVTKNNENSVMTKVSIINMDSLIYEKEVFLANNKKMAYGRMILDEVSGEIINDGPYYTYDKEGEMSSEVIYAQGNVQEIVFEGRTQPEIAYFEYEPPVVADEPVASTTDQSAEKSQSGLIPEKFVRFDANTDDFISNREVDMAVSEFFEDDSITLGQINGLVNFFFEQD